MMASNMPYSRDFDAWNEIKKVLDQPATTSDRDYVPEFREREIWWCAVGVNVGFEQDGKGAKFMRPVLIVRKFGKATFFGVPLTSQDKTGYFYYALGEIEKGVKSIATLSPARVFSANRLVSRIGKIENAQLKLLREKLADVLIKIYPYGKTEGVAHDDPKINGDLYHDYRNQKQKSQLHATKKEAIK